MIGITILAVISPGPDFAMVTRTSYRHGRRSGLSCALGIALGVQVHVCYTVLGVAVVIAHSSLLFNAMKCLGAVYLVYIGIKSVTNRSRIALGEPHEESRSRFAALRAGFLTNALNPKTMLFVVSAYTQVVHVGAARRLDFLYGVFMSFAHWAWFSLIAVFFSSTALRAAMLERQRLLDRVIGAALIALGVSLIFVNGNH
jgi:RhtB (resistance to homoserine/threonine) family protein